MNKYGLELVLTSIKESINQPSDAIFALVHWFLSSSKKFGCVGTGESFGENDTHPSELLSTDWNKCNHDESGAFYIVRYRQRDTNQKFVFKMIHSVGTTWQLLLCRTGDDKTVSMSINVDSEVVNEDGYPFNDVDKLLERIQKDLVDKMIPPELKQPDKKDREPRFLPPGPPDSGQPPPRPHQPYPDIPPHQPFRDPDGPFGGGPLFDPPGGADLDPTGQRGRGGMLMEPPRGGMRGPRFDPPNPFAPGQGIGGFPGRIGRGRGRGNFGDAMGPPDFNNDNMFM